MRITQAFDRYLLVFNALRFDNPYGGPQLIFTPFEVNTQIMFESGIFQQVFDMIAPGRGVTSDESADTFVNAVISGLRTIQQSAQT